jgi:hypothetical protein
MSFAIASLAELPFYNKDVVQSFRSKIAAADALIFAVLEYNFSIPGVLKKCARMVVAPARWQTVRPCSAREPAHVAKPEFHRIDARSGGQFVDE